MTRSQTTIGPRWPAAFAGVLVLATFAVALGSAVAASTAPAGDATDLNRGEPVRMAWAQATSRPAGTPSADATPVAPGCGNEASSPTEIAEVFLAAATARDLARAARCFAPESQPTGWDEVFLGGSEEAWDDVSGCRGLPYVVTESKIRSGVSAIVFNFEQPCAVARLDPWQRDLYEAETLNVTTVVVQIYRADDRWYVWDAFALVTD